MFFRPLLAVRSASEISSLGLLKGDNTSDRYQEYPWHPEKILIASSTQPAAYAYLIEAMQAKCVGEATPSLVPVIRRSNRRSVNGYTDS